MNLSLTTKPLFENKNFIRDPFFSQFVLCHALTVTLLLEILGDGGMGVPQPQLVLGETVLQSSQSF